MRSPAVQIASQTSASRGRSPLEDLGQTQHAGLVVRVVDHDRATLQREQVRSPGVALLIGHERPQPAGDRGRGESDGERRRGGGQRVRGEDARQAGDRDRHVGERDDGMECLALEPRDAAVDHRGRAAVLRERLADRRVRGIERPDPDPAGRMPTHREHPGVVGVEHVPPRGPRDPRDRRLHLRQLIDGVDAVQAEVIGRYVRHDRDVVVQDPDAAEQDAAPRRFEHRDVGAGAEREAGTAEPRVIAPPHASVARVDAIGAGVRHAQAGGLDEVGEQPDRRRLPVRPGDLDHRHGRVRDGRHRPGLRRRDGLCELADHPRRRAPQEILHAAGDRVGRAPPPNRDVARGRRSRPGQARGRAGRGPPGGPRRSPPPAGGSARRRSWRRRADAVRSRRRPAPRTGRRPASCARPGHRSRRATRGRTG